MVTTCPNLIIKICLYIFCLCITLVFPNLLQVNPQFSILAVTWWLSPFITFYYLLCFIKFYMYLQQIICCIYIKMNAFDLQHLYSCPAQGRLMDGKVIDTSLSREPLVVELGKRSVIAGMRLRPCRHYIHNYRTLLNDLIFITTEHC